MGRGLTILVATTLAGGLAIPFVFLALFLLWVHFFIGVASAAYLFGSWLGGIAVATLTIGILLRRGAPNDASLCDSWRFSDESQKEPQPVAFKEAS